MVKKIDSQTDLNAIKPFDIVYNYPMEGDPRDVFEEDSVECSSKIVAEIDSDAYISFTDKMVFNYIEGTLSVRENERFDIKLLLSGHWWYDA